MSIRVLAFACLLLLPGFAHAAVDMDALKKRGDYLARVGDCTSCHTAPGHAPFAGGFKVNSPLGPIYGSNITPDPTYGIGTYTLNDFQRALRKGIAKDGTHLYPAMPYADYTKMTNADIEALYTYFMHGVTPVAEKAPETKLPFPFNQRWAIRFWNWAFLDTRHYRPNGERDEAWNRGAYLVQSPGHCGSCHTPRGLGFQERGLTQSSSTFLSGEMLDHWYAPSLRGDKVAGLGRWSEKDIAQFLATGHGAGAMAFGDMGQVIENSSRYFTEEDRTAIAHYLKSLPASPELSTYRPDSVKDIFERPGAGVYAHFCSSCHGADGKGASDVPALSGNPVVFSHDPTSLIRLVLEGGHAPKVPGDSNPTAMPAFGQKLSDHDIADSLTYTRQSWGNHAPAVGVREVKTLRHDLQNESQ